MNRIVYPILLALLLTACAGTPKVSYYILEAPAIENTALDAQAPTILIASITIPDLVDRPQMVVRNGDNRVEILDTQRWALPLKSEVGRVLAAYLARDARTAKVFLHGQGIGGEADYRVTVDIQRFDSEPGTAVSLEALWTLRRKGMTAPVTGRSAVREAVQGDAPGALAAAHGRALARISRDIATAIK